jgi:hypothetical protein
MITKTKLPSRSAILLPVATTPPWTSEERLLRIEWMTQRINGYVQFMCQRGNLKNTSSEAQDRAIVAFYERMVILERQLGRIHDDFQLQ